MSEPALTVAPEVFERFPDYIVGWVTAAIHQNPVPGFDPLPLLRDAEQRARILYGDIDLKELDAIAVWRSAFTSLGWSASRFPSSVEALVKRVVRGAELPGIHQLVDLANAAALTYLVPVGCHDTARSPGLTVRFSKAGDTFLPMGDGEPEAPAEGEIVYASGTRVRTRRWVWRQSRDALVDAETTNVVIPVDGFADVTASRVDAATRFIATMLESQGIHTVRHGLLDRDHPSTH